MSDNGGEIRYINNHTQVAESNSTGDANMLFKTILVCVSASFVSVYAAAIDTRSTPSPITEFMDINALTQTPPAEHLPSSNTTSSHSTNGTFPSFSLTKRYDFKTAPFKCHGLDYGYAEVDSIVAGIKHLTSSSINKGKPSNEALNCGRVSCSDNAAIWWCNNKKETLTLDSFADIALGAEYVQSKCSYWDDARGKEMVAGEANPGPDWTVVVRKNHC